MTRSKTVTITVRLTAEEERALDRLAQAWGLSRSAAVRRAVVGEESRAKRTAGMSLRERSKEFEGCVKGGPPDLSMRSRELYERGIEEKHRAHLPR